MGKTAANIIAGTCYRGCVDDAMERSDFRRVSLPGGTLWQVGKRCSVEVALLLTWHLAEYVLSCIYSYAPFSVHKGRRGHNASILDPRTDCFDY